MGSTLFLVWVLFGSGQKSSKFSQIKLNDKQEKSPVFTGNQEIFGRSAGIRTRGLLVPKIGLKIQGTLSGAFGAVYYGSRCFPDLSAPILPSAPGVVWVGVWVRTMFCPDLLYEKRSERKPRPPSDGVPFLHQMVG